MKQKIRTATAVSFFPATTDAAAHCADTKTINGIVSVDDEPVDGVAKICPIVETPV